MLARKGETLGAWFTDTGCLEYSALVMKASESILDRCERVFIDDGVPDKICEVKIGGEGRNHCIGYVPFDHRQVDLRAC